MNILIISYYFPPFNTAAGKRISKFAKFMVKKGNHVHVLTCENQGFPLGLDVEISESNITYVPDRSLHLYLIKSLNLKEKVSNKGFNSAINFNPFYLMLGSAYKTFFCWPDAQRGWIKHAIKEGRRILTEIEYDVIYVSGPPFSTFKIALKLSKEFSLPWIAEYRDLWTENHSYNYSKLRRFFENKLEKKFLSEASALVTVSNPLLKRLTKFCIPVWEVRNGYSVEDFDCPHEIFPMLKDENTLYLAYTGTIYAKNYSLSTFCNSILLLKKRGFYLKVFVAGRDSIVLEKMAVNLNIREVFIFLPLLSNKKCLSLLNQSDLLISFLWNDGNEPGIYSAKLFEYLGSRRPIMSIGDPFSEMGKFIQANNIGFVSNCPSILADYMQEVLIAKKSGSVLNSKYPPIEFTRNYQNLLLEKNINRFITRRNSVRRKVCFVVTTPFAINSFLLAPILSLINNNWDITILTNKNQIPVSDKILTSCVKIKSIPIARKISLLGDIISLLYITRNIFYHKYDVVHSITPKAGLLAMIASYICSTPVRIHTFTGQVWATKTGITRYFLKSFDYLIAKSATNILVDSLSQLDFLVSQGVVDTKNATVFGSGSICGVDLNRFRPNKIIRNQVRNNLNIPNDAFLLLFVGRLTEEKGINELVSSFVDLSTANLNLHLLLVGPIETSISQKIKQNKKIHLVEYTSVPENYYCASDLFCSPSYREGFGMTLLEAAATGLPSISTDIYGVRDVVVNGVTGLLVPPRNVEKLTVAINYLIQNPDICSKMGRIARLNAEKKFDESIISCQWVNYYELLFNQLDKSEDPKIYPPN
jgi:glycosyltransferase involved in cell wall biosynthesis